MRRIAPFLFIPALLVFLVAPLRAQDVTGTWELTYSTERGERTMTVTFAQEGTIVTGTVAPQMMGRPGGAGGGNPPANRPEMPPIEIKDGKLENGTLTFSYTMGMGERSFSQSFTATVEGDTMKGTMSGGMRQTEPVPFTGKKKEG